MSIVIEHVFDLEKIIADNLKIKRMIFISLLWIRFCMVISFEFEKQKELVSYRANDNSIVGGFRRTSRNTEWLKIMLAVVRSSRSDAVQTFCD